MAYDASKDTYPLFECQRARNFSQDDWNRFYSRAVDLRQLSEKGAGNVRAGFSAVARTTAGRMQLHDATEAGQKIPILNDSTVPKGEGFYHSGVYDGKGKRIGLGPGTIDANPMELGNITTHEMLHGRQEETGSFLANDAETQAASMMMAVEAGNTSSQYYDPVYAQRHQKNLEKWNKIVKGEETAPDWAEPFKYTPAPGEDVNSPESKERQAAAQKAYVQENASLQTQADYAHEYFTSRATRLKNLHDGTASWQTIARAESYGRLDAPMARPGRAAERNDDDVIDDMVSRNPAINKGYLNNEQRRLCLEASYSHLPDSEKETPEAFETRYNTIRDNDRLSDKEKGKQLHALCKEYKDELNYNTLASRSIEALGLYQKGSGGQTTEGLKMRDEVEGMLRQKASKLNQQMGVETPQAGTGTPQKLGDQRGDKSGRLAATTPVNEGAPRDGQAAEGAVAANDTSNTGDVRGTLRASQERKDNLESENTIVNNGRSGGAEIA